MLGQLEGLQSVFEQLEGLHCVLGQLEGLQSVFEQLEGLHCVLGQLEGKVLSKWQRASSANIDRSVRVIVDKFI